MDYTLFEESAGWLDDVGKVPGYIIRFSQLIISVFISSRPGQWSTHQELQFYTLSPYILSLAVYVTVSGNPFHPKLTTTTRWRTLSEISIPLREFNKYVRLHYFKYEATKTHPHPVLNRIPSHPIPLHSHPQASSILISHSLGAEEHVTR